MNSKPSPLSNSLAPRKPYQSPVLQRYGDIRAMTRNGNSGAAGDGMNGAGMTKTF